MMTEEEHSSMRTTSEMRVELMRSSFARSESVAGRPIMAFPLLGTLTQALGRLTSRISARTLTCEHAGARDLFKQSAPSPAAEYFMVHGALHAVVMRHGDPHAS